MAFAVQQAVSDFHKKYGHPVREELTAIPEDEALQAFEFIEEELGELRAALFAVGDTECGEPGDCILPAGEQCPSRAEGLAGCCCPFLTEEYDPELIEVADALGDIVWTAYGMALRYGIDLDAVLREIAVSNMTKEANGMGKIKKGADYRTPDVALALGLPEDEEEQMETLQAVKARGGL